MQDFLDLLNDRRLYAFSGLVKNQQLWFCQQRPSDGELLLLSAGQIAAAPPAHFLQHGKHVINLRVDLPRFLSCQAGELIFLHRETGKDITPLGHVAETHAGASVGSGVGDAAQPSKDRPGAHGPTPIIDLSSVLLPTPLRPSTAVQVPAATSNDIIQRMAAAAQ
jgi:hypothetical protein